MFSLLRKFMSSLSAPPGLGTPVSQVFTSSQSFAIPTGSKRAVFEVLGAGQNGSPGYNGSGTSYASGAGGAGGNYFSGEVDLKRSDASIAVTVGSGGGLSSSVAMDAARTVSSTGSYGSGVKNTVFYYGGSGGAGAAAYLASSGAGGTGQGGGGAGAPGGRSPWDWANRGGGGGGAGPFGGAGGYGGYGRGDVGQSGTAPGGGGGGGSGQSDSQYPSSSTAAGPGARGQVRVTFY